MLLSDIIQETVKAFEVGTRLQLVVQVIFDTGISGGKLYSHNPFELVVPRSPKKDYTASSVFADLR